VTEQVVEAGVSHRRALVAVAALQLITDMMTDVACSA